MKKLIEEIRNKYKINEKMEVEDLIEIYENVRKFNRENRSEKDKRYFCVNFCYWDIYEMLRYYERKGYVKINKLKNRRLEVFLIK